MAASSSQVRQLRPPGQISSEPSARNLKSINGAAHLRTIILTSGEVVHLPLWTESMQMQPSDAHMLWGMYALPYWASVAFSLVEPETALQHLHKSVSASGASTKHRDVPYVGSGNREGGSKGTSAALVSVVEAGHASNG